MSKDIAVQQELFRLYPWLPTKRSRRTSPFSPQYCYWLLKAKNRQYRREIAQRQNWRCAECREELGYFFHLHHALGYVDPQTGEVLIGHEEFTSLQAVHAEICHRRAHERMAQEAKAA